MVKVSAYQLLMQAPPFPGGLFIGIRRRRANALSPIHAPPSSLINQTSGFP